MYYNNTIDYFRTEKLQIGRLDADQTQTRQVLYMKETNSIRVRPGLKIARKEYSFQPTAAFLITALCYFFMLVLSSKYPIGDKDILISDLEAQYAPFLFLLKNHISAIPGSEHILSALSYDFSLGMGRNIMSTYGYYLSSPFNLLILLFDNTQVNELVILLVGLKLCLSSAFMTMFLRRRSPDRTSKMHILFALTYTFSSYTMVYMFQIMWLDGYMLLPLLLYFVENFLENRRVRGIAVTLVLLFWSQFYIAYMVGIFSFFYLIERMYVRGDFGKIKEALSSIGRFVLTAVFSAMTVAVMLLPVGIDTLSSADVTVSSLNPPIVNHSMIDIIDQLFAGYPGEFNEVLPNNLPLIFMSLAVTLLCFIYFVSPVFKGRERKARAVCFILVYFSFVVAVADIAWHAFDSPNWFSHRQSFVFMPLYLITAFDTFIKIKEVPNRDIYKAGCIGLALIMIAQSFGEMRVRDEVFLYNLIVFGILILILAAMKRTKWPDQLRNMNRLLSMILSVFVVFEICGITPVLSGGVSSLSLYANDSVDTIKDLCALNECAQASEDLEYSFRTENVMSGVGMTESEESASCFCGYNGISLFNSCSNKMCHRFLKQLGYETNFSYFAVRHTFEAPDTDAFLSIGTFFSRTENTYARFVAQDGYGQGYNYYINRQVLPMAFSVDSGAFDFDFYSLESAVDNKDYLAFRNQWYQSMFPEEFSEDFYIAYPGEINPELINCQILNMSDYINPDSDPEDEADKAGGSDSKSDFDPDLIGLEVTRENEGQTCYFRMNEKRPMILNYTFESMSENELYLNISFPRLVSTKMEIYVNGEYLSNYSANSFFSEVLRLGSFPVGEEIQVSIICDGNELRLMGVNFSYLDYETFASEFALIDTDDVIVNSISNGYVSISSDMVSGRTILTSIPYEQGWSLYVDGQKRDITVYQDALIGIDAGAGRHEIELVFVSPGLNTGAVISLLGIAGFIGMAIYSAIFTKNKQNHTTK